MCMFTFKGTGAPFSVISQRAGRQMDSLVSFPRRGGWKGQTQDPDPADRGLCPAWNVTVNFFLA